MRDFYILKLKYFIKEASYPGNIGFEEMVEFWDKASNQDIKKMKKISDQGDWFAFVKLIKSVIGKELK